MQGQAGLKEWAAKGIGSLLQLPPEQCEEIVEHILSFEDPSELQDFLTSFAETTAEHRISSFVSELFQRKNPSAAGGTRQKEQTEPDSRNNGGKGKSKGRGRRDDAAEGRRRGQEDFPKMLMTTRPKDKDDKRLLVIDAASGRHNILTNCLNCGKVIAEEEGWGPCLFCGNPLETGDSFGVRSGDDRGFLELPSGPSSSGNRSAEDNEKFNASFLSAKATKDRLISYDQDAKKRTKVYDDATDWYTEKDNPWLTQRQREDATTKGNEEERKAREEKRKIHFTLDLFGRTVVDNSAAVAAESKKKNKDTLEAWQEKVVDENKLLAMFEDNQKGMGGQTSQLSGDSQNLYDKLRASLHETGKKMMKDANKKSGFGTDAGNAADGKKNTRFKCDDENRIGNEFSDLSSSTFAKSSGDKGVQYLPVEESPYGDADDMGQCLSMHQPWASLLVHGFKRAEGRAWKHAHRGRLWIHAAAKPPETEQIDMLEGTYRSLYDSQGVAIPQMPSECGGYPTSALIGCIDVEACFPQDEYRAVLKSNPSMPAEDNDSEFIFWCLRPRRLIVPVKMGGDHKIWRLPVQSMRAAQRGLQPVRWPVPAAGQTALCSPAFARRDPALGPSPQEEELEEDLEEEEAPLAQPGKATGSSPPTRAPPGATAKAAQRAREPSPRGPPKLDIWPAEGSEERLEVVAHDKDKADRDVVVLQDGFVQLVGFVPADIQQRIVDEMRELGTSSKGFFAEQFDGVKVSKDVSRMYLGMHWNAQAQTWDTTRSNLDGEPAPAIPKFFVDMYNEAVKRANRELTSKANKKRKLVPFPEGTAPSLGVVNFFPAGATMQIHQDRTESKESIAKGFPVMGICIGDSCDFPYGIEQPTASQKPKTLRLESGDVYLFGGSARMLWHGVSRVIPRSAPPSLRLLPGRLSVTLRAN